MLWIFAYPMKGGDYEAWHRSHARPGGGLSATHHAANATSQAVIGAFGEYRDTHHVVTERENSATDRDAVFIANGVNKTNLVELQGFKPWTSAMRMQRSIG